LGFLLNNIDTRDPSMVRVLLPRGGESMGVEIPAGSILSGQYSYNGNGNKVFITFHRMDTSDGKIQKIDATALDTQDYSSGVRGEEFSENGIKIASQMGLSMFAGMTDTLTEKESIGMGATAVQAKPTMKNALLQGMSKAAQDESGRTASEIQSLKDYVVVSEGKEMIIQLLEDFHK
jgi:type IV secretory pathway VirB10-like protein